MARIRSVKPEFWSDADLARAGNDVRCLYIALWNHCDNYGKCKDDPRELHDFAFARCKDIDELKVHEWLEVLVRLGKILRYEADGQRYIKVCTWLEHQHPENPGRNRLPDPAPPLVSHAQHLRHLSWQRLFAEEPELRDGQTSVTLQPPLSEPSAKPVKRGRGVRDGLGLGLGKGEGKGKGATSLPSSEAKDVCISIRDAPSDLLSDRETEFFDGLWKRTRDFVWQYETVFPDGKPVAPDDALRIQEFIKEFGVGPLKTAIETWGKRYPNQFAETGILYVFGDDGESGVLTGCFGKKRSQQSRRPKQPTSDRPAD